jgi:hypothetical protein
MATFEPLKTTALASQPAVVKSWTTLWLGSLVTGIVALSIYVVMLQVLNVPYPADFPKSGWAAFLNLVPVVLGTVWLVALAWPRLQPFSLATRCLVIAVLVTMFNEVLLRRFLMNGWMTTAWLYSFVESLPSLLAVVFYACGAVCILATCQSWRLRLVAGVGVAAVLAFALKPLLDATTAALLLRLAYLNHAARFGFPYGWQVEVPAYLTFVEPVVAALGMAWLIWPQLPAKPNQRLLLFSAVLMLIKGQLFKPFLNMFYDHHGPLVGFVAQSQFTLEFLALVVGIGWVWATAVSYVQPEKQR